MKIQQIGMIKISLKKYQLLLTVNKIGKLKYNKINDLINKIENNTISETLAKQHLNALSEIKKKEIKSKRLINGQKELLKLFDDLLKTILNNSNNNSNNNNNDNNEKE